MFTEFGCDRTSLDGELHGAARNPTRPPAGAAEDWTIPQCWEKFDKEEHGVWDQLFERQQRALRGRALKSFHEGLKVLELSKTGIPEFEDLNGRLSARTGWRVVAVPGLVPDEIFFAHLSKRRLPVGNFVRRRDQLDYIEEPDVFHDVFGHVPMLADPAMADWVQRIGDFGLEAIEDGTIDLLARLYWWTVEFGLAIEHGQTKILGAGILSSFGESAYALEHHAPVRQLFDMAMVLRTPYRSDAFQHRYFVIENLAALVRRIERLSWRELLAIELGR
jgi:phenylalanine-4-hydroxylase